MKKLLFAAIGICFFNVLQAQILKSENGNANSQQAFTGSNQTNSPTALSGHIKYEVWECNCPNLATNTLVTTKLNTIVISLNGKY